MAILEILVGPQPGTQFLLREDRETVIGREGYCDIMIPHASISRRHASVMFANGQYHIQDQGSINGTYLNQEKLTTRSPLRDGDYIKLYHCTLVFYAETPEEFKNKKPKTSINPVIFSGMNSGDQSGSDTMIISENPLSEQRAVSLAKQLEAIGEIHRTLSKRLDIEEALPSVLDILFELFPETVHGQILLLTDEGSLIPRAEKEGREDDSSIFSRQPHIPEAAPHVIQTGQIITRLSNTDSVLSDEEITHITAPVFGPAQTVLGIIHLELETASQQTIPENDLEFILAVGHAAGQAIALAETHRKLLEKERQTQNMELAQKVQARMLPQNPPEIVGYQFSQYYQAALEVGGDFFSYVPVDEHRLAICVGDVVGKGVAAALKMAQFVTEVRHTVAGSKSLKQAMSRLNSTADEDEVGFLTFSLALLDPRTHKLTVVNAGHPPPFCRRAVSGVVETFLPSNSSLPFGILPEQEFHPQTYTLQPGDQVLFYTDGLTEAFNDQSQQFGMKRLKISLATSGQNPDSTVKRVISDINRFTSRARQPDDKCCICLQRLESN